MTVHMTEAALKQIKSGRSYKEFPVYTTDKLICGLIVDVRHKFIGNSDVGNNGDLISSAEHKKVTCPGCIKVLKENSL